MWCCLNVNVGVGEKRVLGHSNVSSLSVSSIGINQIKNIELEKKCQQLWQA